MFYDYLVGASSDGQISKETGLARDWTVSNDNKTFTFYLREGIKFHNGDEVTAEDVKFSIERAIGPASVASNAKLLTDVIESIEVQDPYTLVIRTVNPEIFMLIYMSQIIGGQEGMVVPKNYIMENGDDYFTRHPVGTGPYRVVEFENGSHLKLEAQPNHWLIGVPKYEYVTFLIIPEESTRIAALKTNSADVILISGDALNQVSDYNVFLNAGTATDGGYFDAQWDETSPYSDVRVREAMNIAINRQEIVEYVYNGMVDVAAVGPVANDVYSYGAAKLAPYPYDPERAKQLLAEAGYPDGFDINIMTYPRPAAPLNVVMAEILAGYWAPIGINVNVVLTDWGTARAAVVAKEVENQVRLHGGVGGRPIVSSLYRNLLHSEGLLTSSSYPELDSLIDSIVSANDLDEYADFVRQINTYVHDNYLEIPIASTGALLATTTAITEWEFPKMPYDYGYELQVMQE
ncbi:ABC transporter substrate-binding protein [Chloroflexota bacterium]